MMPYTLPGPIRTNPKHFTILAASICFLAGALVVVRANHWAEHLQSETRHARINEPVTLSIGEARFKLPMEYISSAWQRRISLGHDNSFTSLQLSMAWPDLRASTEPSGWNAELERAVDTIRVELESNPGRESLRARLDPFYRRLARGGELSGPGGLKLLTLSARDAPKTDLIVYDPTVQNGFIARCLRRSSSEQALCHRAIALSRGLEIRYSFDQSLLADWKQLDQAVIDKVQGFRTL